MRSFSWCEEEEFALEGLPHAAQILYLRGLRKRMDYATGLVGVVFKISWQALREVVYVQPHQGTSSTGAMSKEQVRRLVGRLESAGLVEVKTEGKQLVFFLPLAKTDKSAQKKADSCPTVVRTTIPTDVDSTEANDSIGEIGCETEKADIPQNPAPPEKPPYIRDPLSDKDKTLKTIGHSPLVDDAIPSADEPMQAEKKTKPKPSQDDMPPLPDYVPEDAWLGYVAMRKKMRKPVTAHIAELVFRKLWKLMQDGNNPRDVLEQSALNSWAGVFPVNGRNAQHHNGMTRAEQVRATAEKVWADAEAGYKNGTWRPMDV